MTKGDVIARSPRRPWQSHGKVFVGIASSLTLLAMTKGDVIASPSIEGRGNLVVRYLSGNCFRS